jgi:hypothetical protein
MPQTHLPRSALEAVNSHAAADHAASEQPECLCSARDFKLVREGRFGFFRVDGQPVPFRVMSCLHCGLRVTAPRPGRHIALETAALAPDTDDDAMDDAPMLLDTSRYRLQKILRRLGVPKAALEIGCSTGPLVEMLSEAGPQLSIGVELHRTAVAGARRRGRDVPGVSLQACEFNHQSFDVVQARRVLEHVADLHGLSTEVHHAFWVGGHAYLTVPCHETPLATSNNWSGWFPQENLWHFRERTLLAILGQHDLGSFHVCRPLLTDFVQASGSLGTVKKLARSTVRELGLGDTLEVWNERPQ